MEVWNKQVRMQPVDITLRCLVVWICWLCAHFSDPYSVIVKFGQVISCCELPFFFPIFPFDPPWQDTSGNQRFSDVFKGDREWTSGRKGLRWYFGWNFCGQIYVMLCAPLLPLVQFRKCEKHSWKSVTFIKVAGFSLQLY